MKNACTLYSSLPPAAFSPLTVLAANEEKAATINRRRRRRQRRLRWQLAANATANVNGKCCASVCAACCMLHVACCMLEYVLTLGFVRVAYN